MCMSMCMSICFDMPTKMTYTHWANTALITACYICRLYNGQLYNSADDPVQETSSNLEKEIPWQESLWRPSLLSIQIPLLHL